jgi:hypothetical protein
MDLRFERGANFKQEHLHKETIVNIDKCVRASRVCWLCISEHLVLLPVLCTIEMRAKKECKKGLCLSPYIATVYLAHKANLDFILFYLEPPNSSHVW